MKPENEEAMRLARDLQQLTPFLPGEPRNGGGYKDHILAACDHVRRLVEENERMRKALEGIRAEASDTHTDDYGDDQLNESQIGRICDLANEAITPTPAVEAKPAEKCGTCGGASIIWGWRLQTLAPETKCRSWGCKGTLGDHPFRHPIEVDCPDCTTAGGEG